MSTTEKHAKTGKPTKKPRRRHSTKLAPKNLDLKALESFTQQVRGRANVKLQVRLRGGKTQDVPAELIPILETASEILLRGDSVSVTATDDLLTTTQAADILNVSRQYFVTLLEDGKIPFTKTGSHRRVRRADLTAYKKVRDKDRREGIREIMRISEEMGLYQAEYDEVFKKK
ncbi:excisionase family DNA-binding protein [bacterium]|nr:excisionase family DNA-binding protein [bacterium]MCB9479802.1 excisionase family DNA-binding protein [Deltaproteobacteria bacterium]